MRGSRSFRRIELNCAPLRFPAHVIARRPALAPTIAQTFRDCSSAAFDHVRKHFHIAVAGDVGIRRHCDRSSSYTRKGCEIPRGIAIRNNPQRHLIWLSTTLVVRAPVLALANGSSAASALPLCSEH